MSNTKNSPITFKSNGDVTHNNKTIGRWDSFSGVFDVEHTAECDFADGLTRDEAIAWFERLEGIAQDA